MKYIKYLLLVLSVLFSEVAISKAIHQESQEIKTTKTVRAKKEKKKVNAFFIVALVLLAIAIPFLIYGLIIPSVLFLIISTILALLSLIFILISILRKK